MTERELKLISPGGDTLPLTSPFHNEGKTPAGWTVAWGLMLGALVVGVGMIIAVTAVVIVGSVICVAVLLLGGALRAMGRGQPRPSVTQRTE